MRLLRTFLSLSSTKRRLLLAAGVVVAGVRMLLWLLSFGRLLWFVERTALRSARAVPTRFPETENIVWAVTTATRYVPRATCLTQALAAQWLLARFGYPTLLRIGVAKGEEKVLKAHAWLESEGRVVVGGEGLEEYAVLGQP